MTSYEDILALLSDLKPSENQDVRDVEWLTSGRVVGVSRTPGGRIEIFLVGDQLEPKKRVLRRALDYQLWHRTRGDSSLHANRILLPAAGHFDQVAAFLCAELLRNGTDLDLDAGFRRTEPLIELAIAKLRLTDQALLGLVGELLILDALLRASDKENVREILESWRGWRESARDFSWNSMSIEVKTTTRHLSAHQVEGVHQVERLDHSDGGGPEGALFLMSIGLQWQKDQSGGELGHSLPGIVESIAVRIHNATDGAEAIALTEAFLDHVSQYGDDQDVGYDHRTMANSSAFSKPFTILFVRCYDMLDPAIEVLRSENLGPFRHISPESVRFRVELPVRVRGDINPVVGLHAAAEIIIETSQAL